MPVKGICQWHSVYTPLSEGKLAQTPCFCFVHFHRKYWMDIDASTFLNKDFADCCQDLGCKEYLFRGRRGRAGFFGGGILVYHDVKGSWFLLISLLSWHLWLSWVQRSRINQRSSLFLSVLSCLFFLVFPPTSGNPDRSLGCINWEIRKQSGKLKGVIRAIKDWCQIPVSCSLTPMFNLNHRSSNK